MTPQIIVSEEKWCDAIRFLMGLEAGPYLTIADQRFLTDVLHKHGHSFPLESAADLLEKVGWSKAPAALNKLWQNGGANGNGT